MKTLEDLRCEVSLVKSIQEQMLKLSTKLPSYSESEQVIVEKDIDLLQTRSQEMVIFVQVMLKVKQELAYARLDLERSLNKDKEVHENKKRVVWLSERLNKLSKMCHTYFYDIQGKLVNIPQSSPGEKDTNSLCTCGILKLLKESGTPDTIMEQRKDEAGLKMLLKASSDVLVQIPNSNHDSSVQKVYKSPAVPLLKEEKFSNIADDDTSEHVLLPGSMCNEYSTLAPERSITSNCPSYVKEIKRNPADKLDLLIDYQTKALGRLVSNLNHIYDNMDGANSDHSVGNVKDGSSLIHSTLTPSKLDDKQDEAGKYDGKEIPEVTKLQQGIDLTSKASIDQAADALQESSIGNLSSSKLIPLQNKELDGELVKKDIYPRSPSVWCELGAQDSVLFSNVCPVKRRCTGKVRRGSREFGNDHLVSVKGVEGMKKAANKVKVISKLRKLVHVPSSEEDAKNKRIEDLLGDSGIQSTNPNIALDSAKALGQLKCSNDSVITGLKDAIEQGHGKLLAYESAKSLILLGCWEDRAMDILTNHLKRGNKKIQDDILLALKKSTDAHFIPKTSKSMVNLSDQLIYLLNDDNTKLAFNAALSLGHLCINTMKAKQLLLGSLNSSSFTTKYEALNVLVKQMNCMENDVISALLFQLSNANSWKHRMRAIELLQDIGLKRLNQYGMREVFEVLQELLWNHPNKHLRCKIVEVLDEMGLRKEAGTNVLRRIGDHSESVRAHSIASLVTLGLKGEKELKLLLETFELDPSSLVRSEVIKAFVDMKWDHPNIMRALEDRQKANDGLAQKALQAYEYLRDLSV